MCSLPHAVPHTGNAPCARSTLCIPLPLPWQSPPPHFPTTNRAALLKHPCGRSCLCQPYPPACLLGGAGAQVSRGEQRFCMGRRRGGSVHSPALLAWEERGEPGSVTKQRGNGLITCMALPPSSSRADHAHPTACV